MQTLRDYQLTGEQQIRERIRAGYRRVLYVLPTGGGKTTVAASIIHQARGKGSKIVFLAHRKELIDQAKRDIDIDKLEDDQVKQNLREEIEKLRNERDQASKQLFGEPNIIQIDEEEKEVLKAACLDKNGQIMRRTFIGGRFIQAGNLQLGKDNNMEFLKYDEALKSLKAKELIQDIGQKGEIFEISYKGWNLISKLELDK